jgi:hypothetical protein
VTIKRVYTGRNITMFYQDFLHQFAEIAMSPRLLAACLALATERALPEAIALSPIDEGEYVRSWKVYPSTTSGAGRRAAAPTPAGTGPRSTSSSRSVTG